MGFCLSITPFYIVILSFLLYFTDERILCYSIILLIEKILFSMNYCKIKVHRIYILTIWFSVDHISTLLHYRFYLSSIFPTYIGQLNLFLLFLDAYKSSYSSYLIVHSPLIYKALKIIRSTLVSYDKAIEIKKSSDVRV